MNETRPHDLKKFSIGKPARAQSFRCCLSCFFIHQITTLVIAVVFLFIVIQAEIVLNAVWRATTSLRRNHRSVPVSLLLSRLDPVLELGVRPGDFRGRSVVSQIQRKQRDVLPLEALVAENVQNLLALRGISRNARAKGEVAQLNRVGNSVITAARKRKSEIRISTS